MLWKSLCRREERQNTLRAMWDSCAKVLKVHVDLFINTDFSTEPEFKRGCKTFSTSELILHYFLHQQIFIYFKGS